MADYPPGRAAHYVHGCHQIKMKTCPFRTRKRRDAASGHAEEGKKMMYRNSQKVQMNVTDMRLQKRVLLITSAVLLVAVIVLTGIVIRGNSYESRARNQMNQRMLSAVASAIDEVNRMSGIVTSNTGSRLAKVRQYVYYMEQINEISIALSGESGRLAPDDAFVALYSDLTAFETLTQTATASTLDIRTLLLTHLTTLQSIMAGL